MAVEGWRERHDTCRFGTYRPDAGDETLVVACCEHPEMRARYSEDFCAHHCPAHRARPARVVQGRIPVIDEIERPERPTVRESEGRPPGI